MQFRDLVRQYEALKPQIDNALLDTVANGDFIMGKAVMELETMLADYVGVKHCITCANGTDALTLALKAWNCGSGDAVFVPNFTFFATTEAVSLEGANPIFVDVDSDTFNIDIYRLEEAIKKTIDEGKLKPKAIIAVDLFGLPADYSEIKRIADKYKLFLLEDGAQGFGGEINSQKACSFGDISTTSFFPAKPLGCFGDGGAVFTNNDEWAEIIQSLKVHGKGSDKYDNVRIGINSRLDTIQAAILLPKFEGFKSFELNKVNEIASLYTERLKEFVKTPEIPEGYLSSWAQYTIVLKNKEERDALQSFLRKKGIPNMIYYQKTMHEQTVYKQLNTNSFEFPISTILSKIVLSLPIHPYLTKEEVELVCEEIIAFFN